VDRGWHHAGGDLAHRLAFGQDLSARLVVIAGVQVHHGPLRQWADHGDGVQGRGQQTAIAVVGQGGQQGSDLDPEGFKDARWQAGTRLPMTAGSESR
jgi:hypothetical protein